MTISDFKLFLAEHDCEFNVLDDDVILFLYPWDTKDFMNLLGPTAFDDGGVECHMMHGYFAIEMNYILEYYGIALWDVFPENNQT